MRVGQRFHDYVLLILVAILGLIVVTLVDLAASSVRVVSFTDLT
jgi:hypothetical protein